MTATQDATYEIFLKNCAFFARHGVHEGEKQLGQRFFVDARLTVERGPDFGSDAIATTVHYGEVFAEIEALVVGARFNLIETLALTIAKRVRSQFPTIVRAAITVRKPSAPVAGILDYFEVTIVDEG